ncbi:MAG: magnesium transporter [Planctomycetota bacterium]
MPHATFDHGELLERLEEFIQQEAGQVLQLRKFLQNVRAEDVAEILGDFGDDQKSSIFQALPVEKQAVVLDETDATSREKLVQLLPVSTLAPIVNRMPPDEATDLSELLPEPGRGKLLEALDEQRASAIQTLLRHHPESAGGIMTPQFCAVAAQQTSGDVLELLQKTLDTEVVSYVYVVDKSNRLEGVISIREIIAARPDQRVENFMKREVIAARVTDDQEEVANLARKYNLSSIPVVDSWERLVGVATIDDIVDIISDEADEDIYRIAGTAGDHPAHQKVLSRALVRIPWLLLPGLSGFVVAGLLQAGQEHLILWTFVPLIMGISGGVGIQSSTMIVRGLATGEIDMTRMARVFSQELLIGLAIAFCIGSLAIGLMALVIKTQFISEANPRLPAAVGIGLMVGILLATVCGTLLPIACQLIRLDPALVAGPFITGLNDVLAAFCYLTIGHVILS